MEKYPNANVGWFFRLVQIATASVFLGRAWQHIVWDAPFRTLFWDEAWMRPLITGVLGWEWEAYATSPAVDAFISDLIVGFGWFYVLCAGVALGINYLGRIGRIILRLGGIGLIFLAFLYLKERFFFVGQFLEYTLQFSSPFLLVYLSQSKPITKGFLTFVKIAIALTFTCHGLYAVGFYPRPGNFIGMVMNITGLEEGGAISFLNVVGILDFVLSVGLFLPFRWAVLPSVAYAAFWGFGTTIARVWANFYPDYWEQTLLQWLHESVYRIPHFILPLALLLFYLAIWRKPKTAPALTAQESPPSAPSQD
ncbi:MAG: hypothetical protein AAF798_16070 [Bacteroidota bacterium]